MKNCLALFLLSVLLSGCIVSQDSVTFYISENGKVDVVWFSDNIRSSATEDKAKEEKEWLAEFRKQNASQLKSFKQSNAQNISSTLLKETPPYSAVFRASYPTVEAFGRLFDLNGGKESGSVKFIKNKNERGIHFHFPAKKKEKGSTTPERKSDEKIPFPILKIVPSNGKLTETKLCTMDADKESCLLEVQKVDELDHEGKEADFKILWKL